jgi:hypothetical protein
MKKFTNTNARCGWKSSKKLEKSATLPIICRHLIWAETNSSSRCLGRYPTWSGCLVEISSGDGSPTLFSISCHWYSLAQLLILQQGICSDTSSGDCGIPIINGVKLTEISILRSGEIGVESIWETFHPHIFVTITKCYKSWIVSKVSKMFSVPWFCIVRPRNARGSWCRTTSNCKYNCLLDSYSRIYGSLTLSVAPVGVTTSRVLPLVSTWLVLVWFWVHIHDFYSF